MSLQTQGLSRDLLEQVLSRLGLSDRPAPTLDGLQTLYAAWCRKVPFDNVRKLIHLHDHTPGPLPGDDPAEFLTAWLTYGTGGTCWAGNGALHASFLSQSIASMESWLEGQGLRIEDIRHWMAKASTYLSNYMTANVATLARNLVTFAVDVVLMLFTFYYFLRNGEEYFEFVRTLTPLPEEDKTLVFETLRVMLSSTMRGLMLTAVLEGVLLCLGYLITGVPNAVLLGAASGAAGLLPLGGTAFIWIPAVIYLWIGAGWGWAVVLLVWSVIVVGVIDNLLKPLTIGKDTGLPAVALFFGITGGLEVYGLLGLFAGPAVIAVFAALIRVYRRSYSGRPSSPLP